MSEHAAGGDDRHRGAGRRTEARQRQHEQERNGGKAGAHQRPEPGLVGDPSRTGTARRTAPREQASSTVVRRVPGACSSSSVSSAAGGPLADEGAMAASARSRPTRARADGCSPVTSPTITGSAAESADTGATTPWRPSPWPGRTRRGPARRRCRRRRQAEHAGREAAADDQHQHEQQRRPDGLRETTVTRSDAS